MNVEKDELCSSFSIDIINNVFMAVKSEETNYEKSTVFRPRWHY